MSEKTAAKREYAILRTGDDAPTQLRNLRSAVERLYYAAFWHADRPIVQKEFVDNEHGDFEPGVRSAEVSEAKLWEDVRLAAGFRSGQSPEELPYQGIRVTYPLNRLRLLAETVRRGEFSTSQITSFLLLFEDELVARIDDTVRGFIEEKLK